MKRPSGFTLVETLVALLLLSLLVLATAPLFVFATRSTASGADLSAVGAAAVERVELLREIAFYDLPAGGSLTSNVNGYFDSSDQQVLVRWTITDDATPAALKTIVVRAAAVRRSLGPAKEIQLTTVRGRI